MLSDNTGHTPKDNVAPKSGGLKFDSGKPDFTYISSELKELLSLVREYGAKKYTKDGVSGRDNWKKGFRITRSGASCYRHLDAFLNGEDYDPESGICHLAGALASIEHMLNDWLYHPENDDRPQPTTKSRAKPMRRAIK